MDASTLRDDVARLKRRNRVVRVRLVLVPIAAVLATKLGVSVTPSSDSERIAFGKLYPRRLRGGSL